MWRICLPFGKKPPGILQVADVSNCMDKKKQHDAKINFTNVSHFSINIKLITDAKLNNFRLKIIICIIQFILRNAEFSP